MGKQKFVVSMIDSIIDNYYHPNNNLFVKIDAEGFEHKVIEGASRSLKRIIGFQVEMSLVPLYEGAPLFTEMISYLANKGYTLMSIEPGFSNHLTGQLMQIDGIFFRNI
jgi:hypothetical protein